NIILGILFIFFSAVYAQAFETACHKYVQIDPVVEPSLTNPRCRVIDDVFYLEGAVDSQILYEIKTHYPDIRRMELNSYGGEVEAALELAFLIRERNIATNLRKGAKCSSACTLLFQAGVQRTAHHSVRVLYH